MKRILFAVLFALISLNTLFAQAEDPGVRFTSKVTGITFLVPSNAEVIQDNIEAQIIQTPDKLFTLAVEAFNVESATQDEIANHLRDMGLAAGMDLEKSEKVNNENGNVTFSGLSYDFENEGAAIVGVAIVTGTELGFYITLVAGPEQTDIAAMSVVTIDFDPDAVED